MRYGIGMRWWLAAVFAAIAAVTALAVGQLLSQRSEDAFRERAQQLAVGNAFEAAIDVRKARPADLDRGRALENFATAVGEIAERRRLSLFVFDVQGNLLTPTRSRGVDLESIDRRREAVQSALSGDRFVRTNEAVRATIVGIPIRGRDSTALIAYASHPDLGEGIGIVRREIVQAALWAILIGALAGIVVAALIAGRLRRIAAAAAAIEQGRFEIALRPRFRDELGELESSIDRMRRRLKQSFERLRSERDRLEGLLERLQEGVLTVDRGLEIDFANSEAKRLLAVPRLRSGDHLPEPWPAFSLRRFAQQLFGPTAAAVEDRVSPDEDSTFLVVGIPAAADSETAVIVITDVSARERRERAEREFVTNAAHELRTPLTTLTGAVDALQSGAKEDPAERDRFLTHIERESGRLSRLVRALLVLARAQTHEEAPKVARVALRPLLEEVRADLHPRDGVSIEIECPAGLAVLSQRELAMQAIANLAANAARSTERGRIVLSGRRHNGSVAIEVRDSGPGIARRDRERLFDRFYRGTSRDSDGFGLGLAIVREAVRALGGAVSIDSGEEGTSARITLPAADAEAA